MGGVHGDAKSRTQLSNFTFFLFFFFPFFLFFFINYFIFKLYKIVLVLLFHFQFVTKERDIHKGMYTLLIMHDFLFVPIGEK